LRQGLESKDLRIKTREQIKELYKDRKAKFDDYTLNLFEKHFEEKRRKKMELLLDVL